MAGGESIKRKPASQPSFAATGAHDEIHGKVLYEEEAVELQRHALHTSHCGSSRQGKERQQEKVRIQGGYEPK